MIDRKFLSAKLLNVQIVISVINIVKLRILIELSMLSNIHFQKYSNRYKFGKLFMKLQGSGT